MANVYLLDDIEANENHGKNYGLIYSANCNGNVFDSKTNGRRALGGRNEC